MTKLSEVAEQFFPRGTVFRFNPLNHAFGPSVDVMLYLQSEDCLGLVVVTGYKAGHVLLEFPAEAHAPGTVMVKSRWLREHWQNWVWPEVAPSEVTVVGTYPSHQA